MPKPRPPKKHVRYPDHYAWLVLVASLDVMLTWVVLHLGGSEANPVAATVIGRFGLPGMVVFKMVLIVVAVLVAEAVGKRDDRKGRKFAEYAIVLSAFPVVFALVLLFLHH
jgi:Na+-driven multidrug efflux pump